MIFDAHAHIYPDAIALKAAHSIAEFYDIPVLCDGTLGTLLEIGAKNDITGDGFMFDGSFGVKQ